MKRILYYLLSGFSFMLRPLRHGYYMRVFQFAYEVQGVCFKGRAKYIHHDAYIDNIGTIILGDGIVISTKAILLAHDYSALIKTEKNGGGNYMGRLEIGNNVFIGAGAIILPGSIIGNNCIIGAGAVVKGCIPDNSVVIGNPYKIIKSINI